MDITRETQDRWAARSQQRFAAAQAKGLFAAEIVGIEVKAGKQAISFNTDEQPRPDTTVETLAKLRPAFRPDGSITAGNAPGLNSGASAMLVSDRAFADRHGIEPSVRLVRMASRRSSRACLVSAPCRPCSRRWIARAGNWAISSASRSTRRSRRFRSRVARKLGLAEDVVNPEGGAIAHGHAIGATGAVLVTRLAYAMKRDGLKRAMVTLCIGGGQGIALALESVN